jgi:DNA-binding MarR family transcriptional regulator
MNPTPQLLFQLNLAQRLLMNQVDKELKDTLGVTATQAAALIYLCDNNESLMGDLSRQLHQNKSATTTLVERMVKHGFIEKRLSAEDKRAYFLHLTSKGCETGRKALLYAQQRDVELKQQLSEDEHKVISSFLNALIRKYGNGGNDFFIGATNKHLEG